MKEKRGKRREAMSRKIKEKIDTNCDGTVSDAEKQAARTAWKAKLVERFDRNDDGTLDRAEKRRAARLLRRGPRGRTLLRGLRHRHRQGGDAAPVTPSERRTIRTERCAA